MIYKKTTIIYGILLVRSAFPLVIIVLLTNYKTNEDEDRVTKEWQPLEKKYMKQMKDTLDLIFGKKKKKTFWYPITKAELGV